LAAEPVADGRLHIVHGNFGDLGKLASANAIPPLDGLLLDLGLSSFQLDEGERGFSFRFDAPLDMRFDPTQGLSALDIVNAWDDANLASIIWRYGEERHSRAIARAIVAARAAEPIATTGRLAAIINDTLGGRRGKAAHPATKTFQALRIAVNDELGALPPGTRSRAGPAGTRRAAGRHQFPLARRPDRKAIHRARECHLHLSAGTACLHVRSSSPPASCRQGREAVCIRTRRERTQPERDHAGGRTPPR
jgi:hypothetical protein